MSTNCLIVFTRYPEVGKTKTRLIPALGEKGATNLHRKMAEHTLANIKELQKAYPLSTEVHFVGGNSDLMQKWLGSGIVYRNQAEGDLGWRITSAFHTAFSSGMESVAIIGTDCPGVNAKIIEQAFDHLSRCDLVIGPATDGGYYLIGLRRLVPELFKEINWGTSEVLQKTLAIATSLDLAVALLPPLADVDRPEDISEVLGYGINLELRTDL